MENTITYIVKKTSDISEEVGFTIVPVQKPEGGKGKSGIAVSLPNVSDSVFSLVCNDKAGKQFLIDAIDGIRSKIASQLHKENRAITSDRIGITAILAEIQKENQNTRMTKESIALWFDADLAQSIAEAVRNKIPAIDDTRLNKILTSYKTDFQLLASRNAVMSEELKNKLLKAVALLPDDYESVIGEKVLQALTETVVDIGDVL